MLLSNNNNQHPPIIPIRDDSGGISNAERDFIVTSACSSSTSSNGATTTTRSDGRRRDERRPLQLHLTRGENRAVAVVVQGGGTRVTATVTADLVAPPSQDRPQEGSVALSVDLSPAASTAYRYAAPASLGGAAGGSYSSSAAPIADRHQKLATNHILRCLERCLLVTALDTEALCVVPGRYVWRLSIAVTVLDDGGNCLDAAVLACAAAVRHYRQPRVDTTNAAASNHVPRLWPAHLKEPTPLPLHHTPLTVTHALFRRSHDDHADDDDLNHYDDVNNNACCLLVDPTHREELCQTGRVTLALTAHGEICLLDFSGGTELAVADLRECHRRSVKQMGPLSRQLEAALAAADANDAARRLRRVQQQSQQLQMALPPLPGGDDNDTAVPAVPYFCQTKGPLVTTTNDNDAAQQQAAAAEEAAYRRQALDYNRGHVTSRVRENDERTKNKTSNQLLAAMLRSVQGAPGADGAPTTTTSTAAPAATAASGRMPGEEEPASTAAAAPPAALDSQTKQKTPTASSKTTAATTKAPRMDRVDDDDDDDEEETTLMVQSEFQSVAPSTAPPIIIAHGSSQHPPVEGDNNKDDDDVDDLAAAIKTKKKKSKKK